MTAAQHLAQFGVSMEKAKAFILSNLNNIGEIYSVAKQFGVTNEMLAEIYGGVSANDVKNFFKSNGFNPEALETMVEQYKSEFLADDMSELASLVSLNTSSGELSTASLRAKIIANTSVEAYNKAFDPTQYKGYEDGNFSAQDLGLTQLGSLAATSETLQSLYFGTTIKAFKAIDMSEITQIQNFVLNPSNQNGLMTGDVNILAQYTDLMISVFEDPANPQIIPDVQIATILVQSGTTFVQLVGSGDTPALFDGMLMGFA